MGNVIPAGLEIVSSQPLSDSEKLVRSVEKRLDSWYVRVFTPMTTWDSLERLNETQLPPKEAFYSKLNKSHISDEAYEHAQKVWSEFDCENDERLS